MMSRTARYRQRKRTRSRMPRAMTPKTMASTTRAPRMTGQTTTTIRSPRKNRSRTKASPPPLTLGRDALGRGPARDQGLGRAIRIGVALRDALGGLSDLRGMALEHRRLEPGAQPLHQLGLEPLGATAAAVLGAGEPLEVASELGEHLGDAFATTRDARYHRHVPPRIGDGVLLRGGSW